MNRITIKDIAKLVGVNPSTVSRALKDHPDISVKMKTKIQQVAEELGYFPNVQAVNFRNRTSKLLALILPEIGRFFMPDMIGAMEEIARKRGYTFVMFQSDDSLVREKECIKLCRSFGVDGLLVSVSKETLDLNHFEVFQKSEVPVVFVDKVIKENQYPMVSINDYTTAFTAVQYLANRNYKKIAGVFANENLEISVQRKRGFEAALQKFQLPLIPSYVIASDPKKETKELIAQLLKQPNRPEAIFTMTDEILSILIQVVHELEISIPNDLAIISISNGYLPYYCHPRITHIRHSGHQIGRTAASLLVDLIETPSMVNQTQFELETFIVELESC